LSEVRTEIKIFCQKSDGTWIYLTSDSPYGRSDL